MLAACQHLSAVPQLSKSNLFRDKELSNQTSNTKELGTLTRARGPKTTTYDIASNNRKKSK